MEAELRKAFGAEVLLDAGAGGVFDVFLDDQLIYSKHKTGRFPETDEIQSLLQETRA